MVNKILWIGYFNGFVSYKNKLIANDFSIVDVSYRDKNFEKLIYNSNPDLFLINSIIPDGNFIIDEEILRISNKDTWIASTLQTIEDIRAYKRFNNKPIYVVYDEKSSRIDVDFYLKNSNIDGILNLSKSATLDSLIDLYSNFLVKENSTLNKLKRFDKLNLTK